VILSVNAAAVAVELAREVGSALGAGQLYADLNTAAPALKAEVAAAVEATGAVFADVALMAPVPARGIRTPCLVSGSGAIRFAELFEARFGTPVEVVEDAAARKLLRSVFMKGLAAAVLESVAAAGATGQEQWLRRELEAVLEGAHADFLDRLLEGSRRHASRRVREMQAASEMLTELGIEPRVCEAARGWLAQLEAEVAGAGT
jgi:3-hydroxyisobutyrate dehydrogenase-like beta-hydroxyacid dehydrogenase